MVLIIFLKTRHKPGAQRTVHHVRRFLLPHYVLILPNLYFKFCTFQKPQLFKLDFPAIALLWLHQEWRSGQDIWHAWLKWEIVTKLLSKQLRQERPLFTFTRRWGNNTRMKLKRITVCSDGTPFSLTAAINRANERGCRLLSNSDEYLQLPLGGPSRCARYKFKWRWISQTQLRLVWFNFMVVV